MDPAGLLWTRFWVRFKTLSQLVFDSFAKTENSKPEDPDITKPPEPEPEPGGGGAAAGNMLEPAGPAGQSSD